MAPTVIKIQGRATIHSLAELATLVVTVSDSGVDKDQVTENVVTMVKLLQGEILNRLCSPRLANGDISPEAPVSFYSIASLSTSVQDEYDDEENRRTGKKIHRAESELDIRFRDFTQLGITVVQLSQMPYVILGGVTWKLTDERQTLLDEEVRMKALRHAVQRAQAYAQIIGRSQTLTTAQIEDSQEFYPMGRKAQALLQTASREVFGVGVGIEFEPQVIDVSCTLDVEFHAE